MAVGITASAGSWIRINQLGYIPNSTKVAVFVSNEQVEVVRFEVVDAFTGKVVFKSSEVRHMGALGELRTTCRLDFSALGQEDRKGNGIDSGKGIGQEPRKGNVSESRAEGLRRIEKGLRAEGGSCRACRVRAYSKTAGNGKMFVTESEVFPVGAGVYDGAADFVLNYMRQQRCGWNPFLRDSCHTHDAIIVGHPDPAKDSTHLDVIGGWHDASDCLQYTTTSANAIYQMMFAYMQNPSAFADQYKADGTPGSNDIPDIVDEIYWGLQWLDRMNPERGELYNQIADDRDHVAMKLPNYDPADYGWGKNADRPVYFVDGKPQQRGKYMNATMGAASTAGKFASDFALGSQILKPFYPEFAAKIGAKAKDAYQVGVDKPGNAQTVSVVSPYIYEEDNWVDDMELGAMELYRQTGDKSYLSQAVEYGRREPFTPWMGADSARHYQWYPFMNMGHYQVAKLTDNKRLKDEFVRNLRTGIERTYERGRNHPFLWGVPGVWCSNNLTTAMLTQCILYRQLTGDRTYEEMEGALRDWLLGCNPWGTSMIVELPMGGTYPTQPHSGYVYLNKGTTTGGLVDGPVYATIFGSLRGVSLTTGARAAEAHNYELFQPGDVVFHDNMSDYSTNEPTMDGTAALTFPFSTYEAEGREQTGLAEDKNVYEQEGGIIKSDPSKKNISLVFTADEWADGADDIIATLKKNDIKGAFFFTGRFFELHADVVRRLVADGHYVGSHSYGHLLYAPWDNRDSLLVTKQQFVDDMMKSYATLAQFGITKDKAPFFIPPYEYYNSTVCSWAKQMGLQIINFTPGTGTNADYTTPDMKNYRSSDTIMKRLMAYERDHSLNGHLLMVHFGTSPQRTDKFYKRLPQMIKTLKHKGYKFVPLKKNLLEMKNKE